MKSYLLLSCAAISGLSFAAEETMWQMLFNGEDLSGWSGEGYTVEDGSIVSTPEGKILATQGTYAAYVLDLEFKLEPAANNGVGLHYPGHGDGSYSGMEIQVLDDSAEKWNDLKDYQYHGSLYGIAPATRGALRPAGEWNHQRVTVFGPNVMVEVNGQKTLNANLDALQKEFPMHQGLKRRAGHIAFLGHGDKVSFRKINVAELAPWANVEGVKEAGFSPLIQGRSLGGWTHTPDTSNWFVTNGILKHTGEKGEINDLWTKDSYEDFTLVFDWRWSGRGDLKQQPVILPDGGEKTGPDGKLETVEVEELDSGIYLRGNSKSQVNLWNWSVGSGEIYGYRTDANQSAEVKTAATPSQKADRPLGEWNRIMIVVKGQEVTVTLNGIEVINKVSLNEMPEEGPIGLQHHGQAIDFANMWIRRD